MTPRHFAWQAWHLVTSTFVSRGRRGTWRHPPSFCVAGVTLMALGWLWWRAWSPLVAGDAAALCVAGVALGDIHLRFTWQAWHLETSTFVSRGRRGSYGIGLALVARLVAVGRRWRRGTLRGRRGTWWHPPSFHVAGVALGDIHLRFAWQAWYLCHWAVSGGALGRRWSPVTARHFAWQAWHLVTCTFISCGKQGTWRHPPSFRVAGVALGDIYLRFAWQASHLWHWAGYGWLWWCAWSLLVAGRRATLRGRRGTWWHAPSFHVAGVALGDIHLRFAWPAWHLVTSTFVLHGRRGTWWHPPSFCLAGVALGDIQLRLAWQAWHLWHWAGSGGALGHTIFDTPSFTHTTLSHTICDTPRCHRPCFTHHLWHTLFHTHHFVTHHFTHHFVTHHLSHTIFDTPSFTHCQRPSFTHHFVTHNLWHTIFHTPSFTHHFVTHHLSHTTLSHTIFHTPSQTILHTPLCHTPSFTHNFVTHHLSTHHLSHTALSHTIFRHTIFHTPLCHTPFFTHNFVTRSLSHTHTICLCHTPSFTYNFVTHNFVLLLDPLPPLLSFLLSSSPLQHLVLTIGRSCLVGLSGPLIGVQYVIELVESCGEF